MTTQLYHLWAPVPAALVALIALGCSRGDANPPGESTASGFQPALEASGRITPAGAQGYDCARLVGEQEIDGVIGLTGTKLFSSLRGDENQEHPGYSECVYELPGGNGLNIAVFTGEAAEAFDFQWEWNQSRGGEAFSGIGDGALLVTIPVSGSANSSLVVFARAKGRGIRVSGFDVDGPVELVLDKLVKRVAATVAARV